MKAPNRKPERFMIALISIGFMIWSAVFIYESSFIAIDGKRYFCLFDDAMISMRYAWNFSHGFGLVWNPGVYVQGYTNLLMTLLMSFATLVFDKSTAVLFMQVSGAIFMLAIAYVSMKIADHLVQDESHARQVLIRVLAFFGALSYYPLVYWSLMGMETGLLTLLLLLGVLSALNYRASKKPTSLFMVAGYLGLAYLTRNDSILFAFLIWSYLFAATPGIKTNRSPIYQLLRAIGIYALFVIGQGLFQYLYYGEWLPNTYTLKLTGLPLLARIENGIGFVRPFLKEAIFVLVVSGIDLVFNFRKRKLLLFSMVLSGIGYQIYVGGDPWPYWRIMAPCIPLLTILFVNAIYTFIEALAGTQVLSAYFLRNPKFPRKYTSWALVTSFLLFVSVTMNLRFWTEIKFSVKPYQAKANERNVNTAIALNQITTSDATLGVLWAGSLPYFMERRAIDFLGKSDRYIAHLPPDTSGAIAWDGMGSVPGHNKYDLHYSIQTLEPTYVQSLKWGTQNLSEWAADKYIRVEYKQVRLLLLKDSPAVLWSKLYAP